MARVTGVGGVFLRSADPKALGAWYAKHLGIEVGDYGATFLWRDEVPKGTGMTAWNPFPMDTTYFGEGNQAAMINYRVDDLDALLVNLAAAGVWIDPKRMNESYGRFAWIKDCDGSRRPRRSNGGGGGKTYWSPAPAASGWRVTERVLGATYGTHPSTPPCTPLTIWVTKPGCDT
jgi:catechol 2,3-dioxygenase-like lactoylglutathione lyase family enzyme